jgi:hypothetical protein
MLSHYMFRLKLAIIKCFKVPMLKKMLLFSRVPGVCVSKFEDYWFRACGNLDDS